MYQPLVMMCLLLGLCTVPTLAADLYGTPEGAGSADGSSFDHALKIDSTDALSDAWAKLAPGETLYLGSGTYRNVSLRLNTGGSGPDAYKKLLGNDTGDGRPVLQGSWTLDDQDDQSPFAEVRDGADYWHIENLDIRNYKKGINTRKGGGNDGVRIINVDVTESEEGIYFFGGAGATTDPGSKDLVIRDCEFIRFEKRGLRLYGGVRGAKIINCVADAGGEAFAKSPFHIGFSIEKKDAPCSDITYINCEARNSFHKADPGQYQNADGFTAEQRNERIRYENCRAFDNTDGGWDVKASDVVLENCVSMRNKRNFRFWDNDTAARLINCFSGFSAYGGDGAEASEGNLSAGLWARGRVEVTGSTFHNNGVAIDLEDKGDELAGRVTLTDSIVSFTGPFADHATLVRGEGGAKELILQNTLIYIEGVKGDAPEYKDPDRADWDGHGEAFDNATGQGYHAPASGSASEDESPS